MESCKSINARGQGSSDMPYVASEGEVTSRLQLEEHIDSVWLVMPVLDPERERAPLSRERAVKKKHCASALCSVHRGHVGWHVCGRSTALAALENDQMTPSPSTTPTPPPPPPPPPPAATWEEHTSKL